MDLKNVHNDLQKLVELVDGWDAGGDVTALERDLALEKLRNLYETLRWNDVPAPPVDVQVAAPIRPDIDAPAGTDADFQTETPADADGEVVTIVGADIDLIEVLSIDPLSDGASDEMPQSESTPEPLTTHVDPKFEPASESVADQRSDAEPEPVPDQQPAPDHVAVTATLFGVEVESPAHRHRQRVIMSLYNDDPQPVPAPAYSFTKPAPSPAPSAAPEPRIVADAIDRHVPTLSDTISAPRDRAAELRAAEPVVALRQAIGINDKFLLIRDLFGGDARAYDTAIDLLDAFDDLDDCVIHIAENYAWNANSDGAKLLMELLERKLA